MTASIAAGRTGAACIAPGGRGKLWENRWRDNEMAKPTAPQSTAAKSAVKPDGADYRALAEFRFALRQFLDFSGEAARGVGLTPQQHQALLAIKAAALTAEGGGAAPMTVGGLAERLLL